MSEYDDSLEIETADGLSGEEAVTGKSVPAERFNGLMRKLQDTLAENKALKESRASQASEKEVEVAEADPRDELLTELAMENWRAKAVRKYPSVAPFEDLLTGTSLKSVMAVAEDLNSRLNPTSTNDQAETEAPAEEKAKPEAKPEQKTGMPVDGGGSQVTPPDLEDELDAARKVGNWQKVLQLKYKQQGIDW